MAHKPAVEAAPVAPMTVAEAIARRDAKAVTAVLRGDLRQNSSNIPAELKAVKAWLTWEMPEVNPETGKLGKRPYYPGNGRPRRGVQGSIEDRARLGTWELAKAAFQGRPSQAGIGLAMLPDLGLVALDADHCIDAEGRIDPEVLELVDATYAERSPSGTGIRAFWRGTACNGKNHARGLELYSSKQFVTVTGNQVANIYHMLHLPGDELPTLTDDLRARLEGLCKPGKSAGGSGDRLAEAAESDPRLRAIRDAGLYEADLGGGKHSILCPFEDLHSDYGRAPGDGDTAYFQAHTGGHATGAIKCLHTHETSQREYWEAIGYDDDGEGFEDLTEEATPTGADPAGMTRRAAREEMLRLADEAREKSRLEEEATRRQAFEALGLPVPTPWGDLQGDLTERRAIQQRENAAAREALLDSLKTGGAPSVERAEAVKATGLLMENENRRVKAVAELAEHVVDLGAGGDPFARLPHVVERWIPCDEVTLLAGHGGSGKSFVALSLAIHVALGLPFGDLAVTQGTVLFFSAEDPTRVLRQRVAKLCGALMIDPEDLVRIPRQTGH